MTTIVTHQMLEFVPISVTSFISDGYLRAGCFDYVDVIGDEYSPCDVSYIKFAEFLIELFNE